MRATIAAAALVLTVPLVHGQKAPSIDARLAALAPGLSSPAMATRHAALDDLLDAVAEESRLGFDPDYFAALPNFLSRHPGQADVIKLGLIALLQADMHMGPHTEDDSEHWATAIQMVASLKDERTIPALVDAMTTGEMAMNGVTQFGKKALPAVLSRLDSSDSSLRGMAVRAAVTILRREPDTESRDQALSLVRRAIHDNDFVLRIAALSAIDSLSADPRFGAGLQEFVPILQEMALKDPFQLSGDATYPLRRRAQAVLTKLNRRP